jgi:hypothetical protein
MASHVDSTNETDDEEDAEENEIFTEDESDNIPLAKLNKKLSPSHQF